MKVEIVLKSPRHRSIVLIDGEPIKRGLLDFSVDADSELPSVWLKVWPEELRISAERVCLSECDLRRKFGIRSEFRFQLQWALQNLFKDIHKALAELREMWRFSRYEARREMQDDAR